MTSYLSIEELTVSYGAIRVLDRVSLDVERGEMIALLGSSGCGKTTLLRSIAGFVIPDSGAIRVEGRDIAGLPPEKRGTAMMFQSYALWPHMTVAANIGYGLRMRGWKKDAIATRVDEMLALLQLEGFAPRPVTQLSGGQRQRVRSAARSPSIRRCFCSTSRCRISTTRSGWNCVTSSAPCSSASASRLCTLRTIGRKH